MANMLTNVSESVTPQAEAHGAARGRNYGLLAFLYGASGRTELSGVALTRLMGDFGVGESAVRALLARMRKAGDLEGTRHGRAVYYRLAGSFGAGFRRVQAGADRGGPTWDGAFHALLYQVPEGRRPFRDALRRAALLTGYGQLQPGVLISLTDRTEHLAEVLERCPPDARIRRSRLAFEPEEAAAAASDAWDLPAVGAAYRAHLERMRDELAATVRPPAEAASLVRMAELTMTPLSDTLRDPGLPPELLPDGWPLPELWQAISRVHDRYGPPSAAYIDRVIAGEA